MIELTLKAATLAELREMVAAFVGTTPPVTIIGRGLAALIPANDEKPADGKDVTLLGSGETLHVQILGAEGSLAVEDVELPKRTRRTRAQIAADEAAEKALLAANAPSEAAKQLSAAIAQEAAEIADNGDGDFDLLGGPQEAEQTKTTERAVPARVITKDDMMAAARAVMDAPKGGFSVLDKLLKGHGFKQVALIPETAYAAVMADMEEIVGGGL